MSAPLNAHGVFKVERGPSSKCRWNPLESTSFQCEKETRQLMAIVFEINAVVSTCFNSHNPAKWLQSVYRPLACYKMHFTRFSLIDDSNTYKKQIKVEKQFEKPSNMDLKMLPVACHSLGFLSPTHQAACRTCDTSSRLSKTAPSKWYGWMMSPALLYFCSHGLERQTLQTCKRALHYKMNFKDG